MTGFPDSMWRSPARLIHPDHHCSHSHEHGHRDRHRGSERRHDPGCVTRRQDSAKRVKTATSSMSKATEGDSTGRPSRCSDRSRTVSSIISVVGRSRSDGGPMPSGTNGSERHTSRSGEWGRRDRGHGSERCHKSSRFHHSTRHRDSGERARPTFSSGESSSRSKQADVTDVWPSTSTHHQHHHSPCPHLGHRLVVPRLKLQRQRLPAGLPGPVTRRRPFSSSVSVMGRSRSDGGPMPSGTNGSERHRLRSGVWGRRGSRVGETSQFTKVPSLAKTSKEWGEDPAHVFGRVHL